MSAQPLQLDHQLRRLPLVTLYLTERCNSRCVTCDYWRSGHGDLNLASVRQLLPSLVELETQVVLISGGEPLINAEWAEIAELLRRNGLRLWLLTSGLSLEKHARRAAQLFDAITVSLDGTDAQTYAAIRGLNAFENVCAGVRAAAQAGTPLGLRVTVQRANYRQLAQFVPVARELGAQQLSFVAVDVASQHAFGRTGQAAPEVALRPDDLPVLAQIIDRMEREQAAHFSSGLIVDSPRKLRRMHQYFSAVCGLAPYPPVRCNVFDYSAVINASGRVSPCFFIAGASDSGAAELTHALNSDSMIGLRDQIRSGARPECTRCVCSLWRDPQQRTPSDFLMRRSVGV